MSKGDVFFLLVTILLLGFLVTALTYRLSGRVVPFLVVKSGSMYPVLKIGDVIMISDIKPEDLRIGDVIVYYKPGTGQLIVHRIVKKTQSGVYTKGDANPGIDVWCPIPYENIVGRWNGFKIPYWLGIGYLSLFLNGEIYPPFGPILLLCLIILNVVLIVKDLVKGWKSGEESSQ
ncbi:MAG TPA: signal peptidase I [Nitrososphaeria archaeon]|nr:MAG: signal peptidase I [Nitrososphaerota archaeon]HDJ66598.1 signal peptidase I [Nitrososphaeria archaeon]